MDFRSAGGMMHNRSMSKTLICIPFAGGSSFAYSSWESVLPPDWKVHAAELPGRGTLANQRCLTQISDMVDALIAQVEPILLVDNYFVFGHSLGALLAYEMALRLETVGYPAPKGMFLSAANPPHRLILRQRHKRPEDEFLDHLKRLGSVPPELLENPSIRSFILNVLRSDFTALETHRWAEKGQVDCPLYILYSEDDEMVENENLAAWSACSTCPPQFFNVGARGHMYLDSARSDILKVIAEQGGRSFD